MRLQKNTIPFSIETEDNVMFWFLNTSKMAVGIFWSWAKSFFLLAVEASGKRKKILKEAANSCTILYYTEDE